MRKKYINTFHISVLICLLAGCLTACGKQTNPAEGDGPFSATQETAGAEENVSTQAEGLLPDETLAGEDISAGSDSPEGGPAAETERWMEEIQVPNPGDSYFYHGGTPEERNASLQLEMLTDEPNNITDVEEWFAAGQLPALTVPVPYPEWNEPGNLPDFIPEFTETGMRIIQLGQDELYYYAIYGAGFWDAYFLRIYDRTSQALLTTLDFEAYRYGTRDSGLEQRVWWAQVAGDMLCFSTGHGTYAESMPEHAYMAAVSLTDGSLAWKSEPLVSNAYNFAIVEDEIICGYGFTDEADYLYQLDLYTGRILNRIPVRTKPDYLIRKNDILYVRTYNTNYTFRITGVFSAGTEEISSPPSIFLGDPLSSTMNSFRVSPANYTWTRGTGEAEGVSAIACGPHPPDYPLREEDILTLPRYNGMDEALCSLTCDRRPDRILLREWNSADAGSPEAGPLSTQTLQDSFLLLVPDRIYEITLSWEKQHMKERGFYGEASYVVATK